MTKKNNNSQKTTAPLPLNGHFLPDASVDRLLSLFGGNLYHWIYAANPYQSGAAAKPDYSTEKRHPLEPRLLADLYSSPETLVGLRFGTRTRWAGFDLDAGSILNPLAPAASLGKDDASRRLAAEQNLDALKASAERYALIHPVIWQSSHQGGIWIAWAFPCWLPTIQVAALLRKIVLEAGFKLKSGQCEAFPNCKAFQQTSDRRKYTQYKAFRLPLQPETGSYLLDDDLEPVSDDIEVLLNRLDFTATMIDGDEVQRFSALAYEELKLRGRLRSGKAREAWIAELVRIIEQGFTAHGQTNHLLGKIATLGRVRDGLRGEALAQFIEETAIALPGYAEWCKHQHEIAARAREWARSAEDYYWHVSDSDRTQYGSYRDMVERAGVGAHERKADEYHRQRQDETVRQLEQALEALQGRDDITTLTGLFQAACEKARELFGKAFSKRTWQKYKEQFSSLIGTLLRPIQAALAPAGSDAQTTPAAPPEIAETQAQRGSTPCLEKLIGEPLPEIAETQAQRGSTPCSPIMKVFECGSATDFKLAVLALLSLRLPLRFSGCWATGLVDYPDSATNPPRFVNKLKSIAAGAVVEILDAFHTSWWIDNPLEVLVYVKPHGSDWRSGIAVPLQSLHPLPDP